MLENVHESYAAPFLRAFRQAPWRTQTQAVAAWSMTLLITAVVGGLYLAVAARAATAGRDLQALEVRKSELTRDNDELRAELARLRSVTRLADRAQELGFQPARLDQIEYLPVANYPTPPATASVPQVPARPAPVGGTRLPPAVALVGDWLAQALSGWARQAVSGN